MHRTGRAEEVDWRWERSQSAEREATAPPMEWPVITTALLFSITVKICISHMIIIIVTFISPCKKNISLVDQNLEN